MSSKYERRYPYNVYITGFNGNESGETMVRVSAHDKWHAIDIAFTEYQRYQRDRTKYRAFLV